MASNRRLTLRGQRNVCPSCALPFNGNAAFERHRTGDYSNRTRRCRTQEEMRAMGMDKNKAGWWITSPRRYGRYA